MIEGIRPGGERGLVFVISAPSGAGKTTVCRAVAERLGDLRYAVSATTRAPRPGEVDGREYHFLDDAAFDAEVEAGRFLEWARVHANRYGTPLAEVERARAEGRDLLLDLDPQGARQVRERVEGAVLVYLLPPSFAVLEQRLRDRGQDDEATIRRRLQAAEAEAAHVDRYDYAIVNDDLEQAVVRLESVIRAERMRVSRVDLRGATPSP